jgi:hypothetical protein
MGRNEQLWVKVKKSNNQRTIGLEELNRRKNSPDLQRLARRPHEVPQHRNVRAVGADAAGVYGQTELFGQIQIHTRIVQLRQAKALRGQHSVKTSRVDRTGRPMPLPGSAGQFVKLLPIAFVPGRHFIHAVCCSLSYTFLMLRWMLKLSFGWHPKSPRSPSRIPYATR